MAGKAGWKMANRIRRRAATPALALGVLLPLEREQVWGMTFPLDDGKGEDAPVRRFAAEFDALVNRAPRDVVFAEAGSVGQERRRRTLRSAAMPAVGLALAGFWTNSFTDVALNGAGR